jgi:hypothetical protein
MGSPRGAADINCTEMDERLKLLTTQIQQSMVEAGKDDLSESNLENLRVTVRIVIEFADYLQNGSVELAQKVYANPLTAAIDRMDPGYSERRRAASEDPLNRLDLEYACETVLSGVDCFWGLNPSHRTLSGEIESAVDWGMTSSKDDLRSSFLSMFEQFVAEQDFVKKFRMLTDLFKLALVFVAICY